MDPTGVRAVIAILGAVLVFANLVALFGYPALITITVIAAFVALALIVALSAGDMIDKKAPRARPARLPSAVVVARA
jgi:hypothetical protein